jgi:putative hydrolase of the HAD superfamily
MIKAVIFDFGGTLDTDGVHWSAKFWEVYQSIVKSVTLEHFNKAYIYSENLVAHLVNQNDSLLKTLNKQVALQIQYLIETNLLNEKESEKLILNISHCCYSDVLNNVKKTIGILEKLEDDFQLALVSNFYGNLETVLKELSIYHFFSSIIDSTVVNVRKPDPAIFKIAIKALGLDANECVVIGDSYDRDIMPAKQLGCKTIWLKGKSWREPEETSSADYIIKSFTELPFAIKKMVLRNIENKNSY